MLFYINKYEKGLRKYGIWWSGDFENWEEINKNTIGNNEVFIVEKTKEAIVFCKNRIDVHERDGMILPGISKLHNIIKWIKVLSINKEINLIDFGGSLGSVYFAIRSQLCDYKFQWNVVEQSVFVEYGKKYFEDKSLKFFEDFDECARISGSKIILLSSVLPYLKDPYKFIEKCKNFNYVILDRNNFIEGNDRLTIQVVPKHIYPTILPCWFFNENNLIECFIKNGFRMIDKFEGLGGDFTDKYIKNSKFIGHVFEKIQI